MHYADVISPFAGSLGEKKGSQKMRAKTFASLYPYGSNVSNAGDFTRLSVPWDHDRGGSNDPGGRHAMPFARCFHDGKNAERTSKAAAAAARGGKKERLPRRKRINIFPV